MSVSRPQKPFYFYSENNYCLKDLSSHNNCHNKIYWHKSSIFPNSMYLPYKDHTAYSYQKHHTMLYLFLSLELYPRQKNDPKRHILSKNSMEFFMKYISTLTNGM